MVEAMEREGSGRAKFPNKVYNRSSSVCRRSS